MLSEDSEDTITTNTIAATTVLSTTITVSRMSPRPPPEQFAIATTSRTLPPPPGATFTDSSSSILASKVSPEIKFGSITCPMPAEFKSSTSEIISTQKLSMHMSENSDLINLSNTAPMSITSLIEIDKPFLPEFVKIR
nr:hypothetical protein Iba_chr14aCG6340 [Ipomoea batatas]